MDLVFTGLPSSVLSRSCGTSCPRQAGRPDISVATRNGKAGDAGAILSSVATFGHRLAALGLGLTAVALRRDSRSRGDGRTIVRGRNYETNIKKKKGPAERKQAKVTAKHLRNITMAVRDGGPDPSANSMLSRFIKNALKDNVPRDTVDRRIKAFTEQKESFNELEIQGFSLGGAALIVDTMTDNTNRTRSQVTECFKEANGQVSKVGDHIFQKVGVLEFEESDEEKVLEASMEADAEVEDIVTREDGIVEATTLPENFHSAVSAFEGAGMEPSKSEQVVRVQVEATLNHEQSYELLKLLHLLEDLDDIGEIHHNAVLADDVELKLSNYGVPLAYKSAYKK